MDRFQQLRCATCNKKGCLAWKLSRKDITVLFYIFHISTTDAFDLLLRVLRIPSPILAFQPSPSFHRSWVESIICTTIDYKSIKIIILATQQCL